MKMPEPKAWIKHLIGAEAKPSGQCYDIVFTPVDGYSPLYDKQALIDLLEEAAMRAWSHYASACFAAGIDPSTQEQFLAASAIRKLKETL